VSQKKSKTNSKQLQSTLQSLEKALADWQRLIDDPDAGLDEYTKKTRELLRRLSTQIKSLDL